MNRLGRPEVAETLEAAGFSLAYDFASDGVAFALATGEDDALYAANGRDAEDCLYTISAMIWEVEIVPSAIG